MKKATRQQIKTHNVQLILKTIYDDGQISRADIARSTRLTPTTVSEAVAELIREGLVIESGWGPSAGGKPPILLSVNGDARYLIGVDLASSEFRGAVVNLRGQIWRSINLPLDGRIGQDALLLAEQLIEQLAMAAPGAIMGIGIGAPGLMDTRGGMILNAVNLGWYNLPLGARLTEKYDLPVYIANDCQAAALAEMIFGAGRQVSNLVVIRLGRGVGAGIVLNRRLYDGDGFGAGEIGHVVMQRDGVHCGCGHKGCLETLVSGPALMQQASRIVQQNPGGMLSRLSPNGQTVRLETIRQALDGGDPDVSLMIGEAAGYLGQAISHIVSVLGIHHVVLSGSVMDLGPRWVQAIEQYVSQGMLAALSQAAHIQVSALGADSVILGAAALLLSCELGIY